MGLTMHIFTFKLPLRILAIFIVFFLMWATGILTYRGGVEIWGFLQKGYLGSTVAGRLISQMMGWMMAAATFVQSAPIIWDKLSFWGQKFDNFFIKYFRGRLYFLDQVEFLFNEIRRTINIINKEFLAIAKQLVFKAQDKNILKSLQQKLDSQLSVALNSVDKNCEMIIKLLKDHDPADTINRQKKAAADEKLNNFIVMLAETYRKNRSLSQEIENLLNRKSNSS